MLQVLWRRVAYAPSAPTAPSSKRYERNILQLVNLVIAFTGPELQASWSKLGLLATPELLRLTALRESSQTSESASHLEAHQSDSRESSLGVVLASFGFTCQRDKSSVREEAVFLKSLDYNFN